MFKALHTLWRYFWASPYTLLGLFLGCVTLLTGGRMQFRQGQIEFWGGFARLLLRHHLLCRNASALCMGHVILGQTWHDLDWAREHEKVHVRQYERWGILFGPVYLGWSLWLYVRGKNPYYDNPFEKEAYSA